MRPLVTSAASSVTDALSIVRLGSLNGIPTGVHARRKRSLKRIHGALLFGLHLGLCLLLSLGGLLGRLLLSFLLGRPLPASAGNRAHGGTDGCPFSSIAGVRANSSTSCGPARRTLHRSPL